MTDQRNIIERLTEKIPGYSGYAAKERRRDADKAHRERLADELRVAKGSLNEVMRDLSSSGRLMETGAVDRLIRKLDGLENRIRFAAYGYAGFFDSAKVEEPQLDALYRYDFSLTERVQKIANDARALKSQGATAEGLKSATDSLQNELDELARSFDERHRVIENFSSVPPMSL